MCNSKAELSFIFGCKVHDRKRVKACVMAKVDYVGTVHTTVWPLQ